jgi:hypothetical protein
MAQLRDTHKVVLAQMNALGSRDQPASLSYTRMGPLLSKGWQLAADWADIWFEQHPKPSADDLDKLFIDFAPPPAYPEVYDPKTPHLFAMVGSGTQIGVDIYVVEATYETYGSEATSTFFVICRDSDGNFRSKWSVKPLAAKHFPLKDEIGLWAFVGSCAYYCGPLIVQKTFPLTPSGTGRPRFAIDAVQATNGNTLMKQFSIWEWDGESAKPLLIRSYKDYVDDKREIRVLSDQVSIPTKEETRSFSSFGCCAEPRGIWLVRLEPSEVKNLGHRFVQPEIAWADRLLATKRGASPAVLRYLRHAELDADMIDKCKVLHSGQTGDFEISFGEGTTLWLAYRLRNGRPYFTAIRVR